MSAENDVWKVLANRRHAVFGVGCLVVAVAIGLYGKSVQNEFIWDDPIIFQRQLPYFDSIRNVIFPPTRNIPQFGVSYYRPLIVVSFQLDEWTTRTFWPLEQREEARRLVYHLSVVIYHGVATLLVFMFGLSLGRATGMPPPSDIAVSGLGALLFATHPIHVESVSWMAGRSDVICGIFLLLSLIFYIRVRGSGSVLDGSLFGMFAAAAMLSKETGVAIVLAVALLELVLAGTSVSAGREAPRLSRAERRRLQRSQKRSRDQKVSRVWSKRPGQLLAWILLGVVLFGYLALRNAVLETIGTRAGLFSTSGVQSLMGSVGWYLRKSVYPPPQSGFVTESPGAGHFVLGVVVSVAFAVVLVWHVRRRTRFNAELIMAGLFFVTLAPSLSIALLRISETSLAERYLYVPTVGLCLLVPALLFRAASVVPHLSGVMRIIAVAAVVIAIVVPSAWATVVRSRVWSSDLEFWVDTVEKSPNEGLPHLHLGIAYGRLGQHERAIERYRIALERYNDAEGRSKALNNMGSVFLRLQNFEAAAESFRRAIEEVPRYPTAYYNWALVENSLAVQSDDPQQRQQRIENALSHFRQALSMNPRYVKAHLQYGKLLISLGQVAQGRQHLQQVVELAPATAEARDARSQLANSPGS